MISARQLTKIFVQPQPEPVSSTSTWRQSGSVHIRAVDAVDLDIAQGTVFGLIGPNGAGKTTLVRILSTLIIPTSGSAAINGFDISRQGRRVRESIGLAVGGERSFYWRLTGRQNLEFFSALQGLKGRHLRKRAGNLLESFDLVEAADKPFRFYSSGMKRKLDLARALLTDPPILLLDEPTTGIDPHAAVKIRQAIALFRQSGKTILLVTHNLAEAERLCDAIGVMDHGKLIAVGAVTALRSLSDRCRIKVQMGTHLAAARLSSLLGELPGVDLVESRDLELSVLVRRREDTITPILQVIASAGCSIRSLSTEQPTLEDVFFKIVGGNTPS